MRTVRLAALCTLVLATGACATSGYLDPSGAPTFGQRVLRAGFTPDPLLVEITAGGDLDASSLGGDCAGAIAPTPDYRVTYTAGSYPLSFAAVGGSADLTLVINGPDGEYYCDDDSGGDSDPLITFTRPASGVYDIWVGVYSGGSAESVLYITEE